MDDSQFGALTKVTADSIIKSLHSNENIPKEITDKIEENIEKRIGEIPSMVGVEKEVLDQEEVCKIIKNWQEGVKKAPNLKGDYAAWLDIRANKKFKLKECSVTIQDQNDPQSSEKVDDAKRK